MWRNVNKQLIFMWLSSSRTDGISGLNNTFLWCVIMGEEEIWRISKLEARQEAKLTQGRHKGLKKPIFIHPNSRLRTKRFAYGLGRTHWLDTRDCRPEAEWMNLGNQQRSGGGGINMNIKYGRLHVAKKNDWMQKSSNPSEIIQMLAIRFGLSIRLVCSADAHFFIWIDWAVGSIWKSTKNSIWLGSNHFDIWFIGFDQSWIVRIDIWL